MRVGSIDLEMHEAEEVPVREAMRHPGWIAILLVVCVSPLQAQEQKKAEDPASQKPVTRRIRGRVVDQAGKPVAGITVAPTWLRQEDVPVRPIPGTAKTDDQGQFGLEMTFLHGRSRVLYALDPERRRGGLAVVGPKTPDEPITIKAGPLVHVHGQYTCKDLGKPVGWTNSMFISMPDRSRFYQHMTKKAEFSVLLPPGTYSFQGYGESDVESHRADLTLAPDKLDVDLGAIDLAASPIAKLKGKPAPSLHPTDVRGVSKGVQIADYKGKWVVLEFWGTWCGPCIARAMPELMEIYDDHPDERDKFVVLTVHSPIAGKDFAEVDANLKAVVRDTWHGRMMPFPILLDANGTMRDTFGVHFWPTTILFDPEGKLVGVIQPEGLAAKLKPIPPSLALPRQLDRDLVSYFNDGTIEESLARLQRSARKDFELDPEALRSLPLREKTKVPLTFSGRISLRSALELLLDPLDLTYKIGLKGYIITTKRPADSGSPSSLPLPQDYSAARIAGKLKDSKSSYDFDKTPLSKVAAFFERQSGENVVLDPRGRMDGKIDPAMPITGSGKGVPLGEALERLLGPLGLRPAVRDEVIVLEAKASHPVDAAAAR